MRLCLLAGVCLAQQIGTLTPENHPSLSTQTCTSSGCTSESNEIVLDSNWRWLHKVGDAKNCYTGNTWDTSLCPDPQSCSTNCALDGGDYQGTYGIHASGQSLKLDFVTVGPYSTNIGSRVYLMNPGGNEYKMFKLLNREFTFDVDMSQLPCGLNGALYFVEMAPDGGSAQYPLDKAGARYGSGYCDAQCPHDMKFIDGEANILDWTPSPTDKNSGTGRYGTCCAEMDIWEANTRATAYTAHPCNVKGQTRCGSGTGVDCGDGAARDKGACDKDGCDFNSYRLGNTTFIGAGSGFAIDTTKLVTVVTQFITSNGQDDGPLSEIRRIYVQNGKVFSNSQSTNVGQKFSSLSDNMCKTVKSVFGDPNDFADRGGMQAMGDSFGRGMVLVMSLWDDHAAHMLWLDSNYPTDKTGPGVARGPCATSSGDPVDVERDSPHSSVTFSNIKFGTIGSTYPH